MLPNFHSWRWKKVSISENRFAFENGGETADYSQRHVDAVNDSEKEATYPKVKERVEQFMKGGKEFQDKQKNDVIQAIKGHEKILNMKVSAQMGLFMNSPEFKSVDPSKRDDIVKTRSASLARDAAALFNQRSLGQNLLATVIVDGTGLSGIVLELKPQAPASKPEEIPADLKANIEKVTQGWPEGAKNIVLDQDLANQKIVVQAILKLPATQHKDLGAFIDRALKLDPKMRDIVLTDPKDRTKEDIARINAFEKSIPKGQAEAGRAFNKAYFSIRLEASVEPSPGGNKEDAKGQSEKPAGAAKKPGENKPEPDQKLLDATRAKLGPNTQKAVASLSPTDQVAVVRAIAALPNDQAAIETFLGNPAVAAKVPFLMMVISSIAGKDVKDLVSMVENKNAKDPVKDLQNAELLSRLAKTIMHAQKGPIPPDTKLGEVPPPKNEGERLQRELVDSMAIISDPTKSIGDKITAALSAIGTLTEMITNMKDLKGPPKTGSKSGPEGKAGAGGVEGSKLDASGLKALKAKAKEKGSPTLKDYEEKQTTEKTKADAVVKNSKDDLQKAETELPAKEIALKRIQDTPEDKRTESEKLQLPKLQEEIGGLKAKIEALKKVVSENETKVKTIEAELKQLKTAREDADSLKKQIDSTFNEMRRAVMDITEKDGKAVAKPKPGMELIAAILQTQVKINDDYDASLVLDSEASRMKLQTTVRSMGIPSTDADMGWDADGKITNPDNFLKTMKQMLDKTLNPQKDNPDGKKQGADTTPPKEEPKKNEVKPKEEEKKDETPKEKTKDELVEEQMTKLGERAANVAKTFNLGQIRFSDTTKTMVAVNQLTARLDALEKALPTLDDKTKQLIAGMSISLSLEAGDAYAYAGSDKKGNIVLRMGVSDMAKTIMEKVPEIGVDRVVKDIQSKHGLKDIYISSNSDAEKTISTLQILDKVLTKLNCSPRQ
jgi:hypothetical protein